MGIFDFFFFKFMKKINKDKIYKNIIMDLR
jgi:hypothetical protein